MMRQDQLKNMNNNCSQCVRYANPKTPQPQLVNNPCINCMYNAVMVKSNNFESKPRGTTA